MEGDLSLSQSLGGLRIANPDDALAHEQSSSSEVNQTRTSMATSIPEPYPESRQHLPEIASDQPGRPLSQLNFDPSTYNSQDYGLSASPAAIQATPISRQGSTKRKLVSNGESSSQQQYGQQYRQGYPQAQRQHPTAPRQAPPVYGQVGSSLPPADHSYRLHRETSQSSMDGNPRRNGSRASHAAVQAGVPVSESGYNDRSYRNVQHTSGNAPYPPRRSSKNMAPGYMNGQPSPAHIAGAVSRQNSDDWRATGSRTVLDANGRPVLDSNGQPVRRTIKRGVDDFQFGVTLGEGSYSTVVKATDRETGNAYAIKCLDKRHIIKEKKVKYVNIEKETLNRLNEYPGVVRLYYTFQDDRQLYFVLDLASGGELLGVLKKYGTFDEECTRFYGAQILSSVEYMHSKGVIHRDLKPENILLNERMHSKITDFGTAKILEPRSRSNSNAGPLPGAAEPVQQEATASFVGTAEYVSPELLSDRDAGKPSDLWAFGCIIYQLLAGRPPFKAANEYLTFQKIMALEYTFPRGFPPVARDLVERLLVLDPTRRLTMDHIKNHEFFADITFGRGLWQQKPPQLKSYKPPMVIQSLNASSTYHNRDLSASAPPDIQPAHSTKPVHISANGTTGSATPKRPQPRLITEVPPPSQLDVEWSPILTRSNERIIKVGQQIVLVNSVATSPGAKAEKPNGNAFARLFGGGGNGRKKQRLIMVTSSGRILLAASDGNEKKTKMEISLLYEGCTWKKLQDPKGLSYWIIEIKDKHFSFEDPKFSSPTPESTSTATDEWLESLEKAKEMALSLSLANSFSDTSAGFLSGMSSSTNTLDLNAQQRSADAGSRHILHKTQSTNSADELKGFKRFSKRQSKSGLAAVF